MEIQNDIDDHCNVVLKEFIKKIESYLIQNLAPLAIDKNVEILREKLQLKVKTSFERNVSLFEEEKSGNNKHQQQFNILTSSSIIINDLASKLPHDDKRKMCLINKCFAILELLLFDNVSLMNEIQKHYSEITKIYQKALQTEPASNWLISLEHVIMDKYKVQSPEYKDIAQKIYRIFKPALVKDDEDVVVLDDNIIVKGYIDLISIFVL